MAPIVRRRRSEIGTVLLWFIFLYFLVKQANSDVTTIRLCADEKCSVPVSMGRTLITYNSPDKHVISFRSNANVVIYAKTDGDLWEGQIAGKRGYIPKRFVQETKIIKSHKSLLAVLSEDTSSKSSVSAAQRVTPDVNSHEYSAVLPSAEATSAVWFSEHDLKPADVAGLLGGGLGVNADYASVHSERLDVMEENFKGLNGDHLQVVDNAQYVLVDDSKIPVDVTNGRLPVLIQTPEAVALQSVSLSLDAESTVSSATIKAVETMTEEIQPTPTVSVDSPSSVSSAETKMLTLNSDQLLATPKNSDNVGLLDDLLDYVDTKLTVFLKGENGAENPPNRVLRPTNSDGDGTEQLSNSSVDLIDIDAVDSTLASTLASDHVTESITVSQGQTDKYEEHNATNICETVLPTKGSDVKISADDSIDDTKLRERFEPDAEVAVSPVEERGSTNRSDSKSEQIDGVPKSGTHISDTPRGAKTESSVVSGATSGTVVQNKKNTVQIDEPRIIADEINLIEDEHEEEENYDEDEDDDKEDDDVNVAEADVVERLRNVGHNNEKSADSSVKANTGGERSYFNDAKLELVEYGLEATNVVDEDSVSSSSVKLVAPLTDPNISQVMHAHASLSPNEASESSMMTEEDDNTVDTILANGFVEYDHPEKNVIEEDASVAPRISVDVSGVSSVDTLLTWRRSAQETMATVESKDEHKVDILRESATAEESLESLVPIAAKRLFSNNYVVSTNFLREDSEKHVMEEADVDSCDANSFEGNCPKVFTQGSNVEDEEARESIDYLQITLDYLTILKECAQFILDYVPEPLHSLLCDLESSSVSPRVVVFTFIVGSFVLTVQIAIMTIQKYSKERSLMVKLCDLDRMHFAMSRERDEFKEKLDTINHNMAAWKTDYVGAQEALHMLQSELEASKGECGVLRASVANLEDQLEEATEAGLELNRMLSEFLASQSDGGRLQESVERLQEQLDAQRGRMADLQLVSDGTALENQKLKVELRTLVETNEENLSELRNNVTRLLQAEAFVDDLRMDIARRNDQIETLQESNGQLFRESQVWNETVSELQNRIDVYEIKMHEISESLEFKSNEVESLKECVAKLRKITQESGTDGELSADDVDAVWKSLLDVAALKSELATAVKERDGFTAKVLAENEARRDAEVLSRQAIEEAAVLRREFNVANQEREEAAKKLEILASYFKEKEMQLQKELGVQEAIRQQNQESVASVYVKMNLFEQEVGHYKSQIASLKLEIESQERSYKNQIANQEKKAHDNWLAARSAERRLEESKQEAAALRNKLTLQKKNNGQSGSQSQTHSKYATLGSNGEVGRDDLSSPPRLAQSDRYDSSQDLPSSSGRSSLYREPLDFNRVSLPFLPIDRPLPPPFLRGLPPGPPLPVLLPPLLTPLPFDVDRGGHMIPPPAPLLYDPKRAPPEHGWMRGPSSPPLSSVPRHGRYDNRHSRTPLHDDAPRGHPRYPADAGFFNRGMQPAPDGGGRSAMPSHLRRDSIPCQSSDRRIDPKTSPPHVTDDSMTSV